MATNNVLVNEIYDHFLVCKICSEGYKGPKTLACQHTFCKDCLVKHHDTEQQRQHGYRFLSRSVSCPVCHKRTDLPIGGIPKLSDNFLVSNLYDVVERRRQQQGGQAKFTSAASAASAAAAQCDICRPTTMTTGARTRVGNDNHAYYRCLDCSKTLCRRCADLHRRTKVTRDHGLFDVGVRERDVQCRVHRDETIRFYCEPCGECICVLCTFQDQHKDHEVFTFTEGLERHGRSFDGLIERSRARCRRLREQIELIARCEANAKATEDCVREFAMDLVRQVRRQEREILRELKELFGAGKAREFVQQKTVLQETLHALENTCSLTEIVVKDRGVELLMLKNEINQKLNKLLADDRFLASPDFLARSVVFVPGNCTLGELNFEDEDCHEEHSARYHVTKSKRTEHGSSSSFDPAIPRYISDDGGGRQEVKDFEDDESFNNTKEEGDKTDRKQTDERRSAGSLSREASKRNGRTRACQNEATPETIQSSSKAQSPNGECRCSNKRISISFVDRATMTSTTFDAKFDKVLDTDGLICTENQSTQSTQTEVRTVETATDAVLMANKATDPMAPEYLDKSVATESSYFLNTVDDAKEIAPDAVTTTNRTTRTESDHAEADSVDRLPTVTTRVKHCSSSSTTASPRKSRSAGGDRGDGSLSSTTACHGYEVLRRQTRISLSRGTATVPVPTVERGTSTDPPPPPPPPPNPAGGLTERASSPVRFSTVDKAVSASSGEIAEPVDTFQLSGKHQKLFSKSGPKLDVICEDSEEPSSSSEEEEEEDGLPPTGPLPMRQRFTARGLASSSSEQIQKGGGVLTHREKFAPSFGSRLRGPPQTSSIFSVEGRRSASSILWKVEMGTNTSFVDLQDKAVGTDSPMLDTKMAECISKLKTVRRRLETKQTANASTSTSGSKESPEMTTSTSSFESTERRSSAATALPPSPTSPRLLAERRNKMTLSVDQTYLSSPRKQRHRTAYARPADSSPSESSDPDQTSPMTTTTSTSQRVLPTTPTTRRPPTTALARKQRTAIGDALRVSSGSTAAKERSPRIIRKQHEQTSSQNT